MRQAAGEQRPERLASGAGDPGHAHDLPGADVEVQPGDPASAQPPDPEDRIPPGLSRPLPARGGIGDGDRVTHDELGEAAVIDLGPRDRGRDAAVAQDGDPVSDAQDLAQVMRDEQHAVPLGPEPVDRIEEPADLA